MVDHYISDSLEILLPHDSTGRVVREVDDHRLCLWRDCFHQPVCPEFEVIFYQALHWYWCPAGKRHAGGI